MRNSQAVAGNNKKKSAKSTPTVNPDKPTVKRQTKKTRATVEPKKATEPVLILQKLEDGKSKKTVAKNKVNETKDNQNIKDESPRQITAYFKTLSVTCSQIENSQNSNEDNSLSSGQSSKDTSSNSPKKNLRQQRNDSKKKGAESHKLTEYFNYRRSERKYKKNINDEVQKDTENRIINQIEDGLKVKIFEEKGRGIVTTKDFYKGEFVVEYIGELIDGPTAKQREIKYSKSTKYGCYMYYFKHKDRKYCIDATAESGKLGRLINHSRKGSNLTSKIVEVNQEPHIILVAKIDIPSGTELLYDYGDRNQESLQSHPWLAL